MFANLCNDYHRHGKKVFGNPAFGAMCNYRFGRWALNIRFAPLRWLASKIYGMHSFFLLVTCCVELNRMAKIGEGFHLVHGSNIHIHPDVIIGDRCGIMHDVTIGTNMGEGAPKIGNDVFIGAGAKVLGDISVGDNVIISANSLVTSNVPPNSIAIGVPARSIKRDRLDVCKMNLIKR